MERGFKSRCEEMSRSLRFALDLKATDPLPAERLASYLDVLVWSVHDIGLSIEDLHQLVEVDADSWSAITVSAFGREAIVVNPTHQGGRYSSDVMHEVAHLILGHEPNTVFFVDDSDMALREYNDSSEREADWLAGALLLPRDALVLVKRRRISDPDACSLFQVSQQMLKFRLDVTGVNRQFRRRK